LDGLEDLDAESGNTATACPGFSARAEAARQKTGTVERGVELDQAISGSRSPNPSSPSLFMVGWLSEQRARSESEGSKRRFSRTWCPLHEARRVAKSRRQGSLSEVWNLDLPKGRPTRAIDDRKASGSIDRKCRRRVRIRADRALGGDIAQRAVPFAVGTRVWIDREARETPKAFKCAGYPKSRNPSPEFPPFRCRRASGRPSGRESGCAHPEMTSVRGQISIRSRSERSEVRNGGGQEPRRAARLMEEPIGFGDVFRDGRCSEPGIVIRFSGSGSQGARRGTASSIRNSRSRVRSPHPIRDRQVSTSSRV